MRASTHDDPTIAWLLAGDPAIRWQTMRDLLDAPAKVWQTERKRTLTEGWGARLLARQDADGRWGGGLYSPKWISTTYTLLLLRDIGIPQDCAAAQHGARLAVDGLLGEQRDDDFAQRLVALDRCIVGMLLAISVYFRVTDVRTDAIVDNLLDELMPDGAWNCRRHTRARPTHSSFHTTLNVLDGLREYLDSGRRRAADKVRADEKSALELLLQHRLFRSDKTGEVIRPEFAEGAFPHRWHYDYMRALAYFARANAPRDRRLEESIALLKSRRNRDGRWSAGKQYSGRVFFRFEPPGPSRWNTLRALRILRWWDEGSAGSGRRRETQRGHAWNISSTS
jgi:hypothetical protein